jgi:hypothetical protein
MANIAILAQARRNLHPSTKLFALPALPWQKESGEAGQGTLPRSARRVRLGPASTQRTAAPLLFSKPPGEPTRGRAEPNAPHGELPCGAVLSPKIFMHIHTHICATLGPWGDPPITSHEMGGPMRELKVLFKYV